MSQLLAGLRSMRSASAASQPLRMLYDFSRFNGHPQEDYRRHPAGRVKDDFWAPPAEELDSLLSKDVGPVLSDPTARPSGLLSIVSAERPTITCPHYQESVRLSSEIPMAKKQQAIPASAFSLTCPAILDWQVGADSDYGGYSYALMEQHQHFARFRGYVSYLTPRGKDQSGYAYARSLVRNSGPLRNRDTSLAGFDAVDVCVRGDGRMYNLSLSASSEGAIGELFQNVIYTSDPHSELERHPASSDSDSDDDPLGPFRVVSPPIARASVSSFGLSPADRVDGPFRLDIKWIRARRWTPAERDAYTKRLEMDMRAGMHGYRFPSRGSGPSPRGNWGGWSFVPGQPDPIFARADQSPTPAPAVRAQESAADRAAAATHAASVAAGLASDSEDEPMRRSAQPEDAGAGAASTINPASSVEPDPSQSNNTRSFSRLVQEAQARNMDLDEMGAVGFNERSSEEFLQRQHARWLEFLEHQELYVPSPHDLREYDAGRGDILDPDNQYELGPEVEGRQARRTDHLASEEQWDGTVGSAHVDSYAQTMEGFSPAAFAERYATATGPDPKGAAGSQAGQAHGSGTHDPASGPSSGGSGSSDGPRAATAHGQGSPLEAFNRPDFVHFDDDYTSRGFSSDAPGFDQASVRPEDILSSQHPHFDTLPLRRQYEILLRESRRAEVNYDYSHRHWRDSLSSFDWITHQAPGGANDPAAKADGAGEAVERSYRPRPKARFASGPVNMDDLDLTERVRHLKRKSILHQVDQQSMDIRNDVADIRKAEMTARLANSRKRSPLPFLVNDWYRKIFGKFLIPDSELLYEQDAAEEAARKQKKQAEKPTSKPWP
ncbi:hypothetical protein H696_04028 [Fonticula alba]|uniref:NADH:ubiquinone oxidoreductase intermediate-associated protein 30 domain-containing protein n=1 Tax=Fonticula alba TaxID=691883 RepID=A0A058Z5Q1_FONAL|nr:hypothetical protein H696_04028 [Fonticula alba]KCV69609.1 hypothetical protein H696_04028 [Fonticula alba]|eukprot:XP_009496174.1 hypothetical protein H696_04028 [Fonticula alba]